MLERNSQEMEGVKKKKNHYSCSKISDYRLLKKSTRQELFLCCSNAALTRFPHFFVLKFRLELGIIFLFTKEKGIVLFQYFFLDRYSEATKSKESTSFNISFETAIQGGT